MEETKNAIPLIGDAFPEMEVKTTHGVKVLPRDYSGKWLVLFSHPADFTPVCTTEFVAFQERYHAFRELNTELMGLSVDQVFSHIKWVDWIRDNLKVQIEFPIIADDGSISSRLGFIHPKKGSHTVRAVFFIDPKGIIRAILYYPQELGRNFDEILRVVKALQVSDAQKVAMPADWPRNGLWGDDVIVPPPTDIETARAREGQEGCLDWWLCHKKLQS